MKKSRFCPIFSMEIPKNQIIGVIGKSGSGKSTFLKLLMRFWQTDAGTIQISEKSIDTVNTTDLRRMESYMTQETQLFHDSITNNVRVAKPDASMEEIENACKKASLHDFILSLPKGLRNGGRGAWRYAFRRRAAANRTCRGHFCMTPI